MLIELNWINTYLTQLVIKWVWVLFKWVSLDGQISSGWFYHPRQDDDNKCNTTKAGPGSTYNATAAHKAGTSIALDGSPFVLFLIVNTLTFVFSNSILLVLVPAGHNSTPFFVPNIYLWCCYFNLFIPYHNTGSRLDSFNS